MKVKRFCGAGQSSGHMKEDKDGGAWNAPWSVLKATLALLSQGFQIYPRYPRLHRGPWHCREGKVKAKQAGLSDPFQPSMPRNSFNVSTGNTEFPILGSVENGSEKAKWTGVPN